MKFKAFAIISHPGEIEFKPLVLCKECRFLDCVGCVLGNGCSAGGDWFCADGEKREDNDKRNGDTE